MSIIGAGIAGLATAIAARRQGFDAFVYESRKEPPNVGNVLLLWANGIKALRALDPGLERAAIDAGTIVRQTEFRTWGGARLCSLPMSQMRRQYGAEAVFIPRSTLAALLEREATKLGATIRWGAPCTGYSIVGRRVRARLAGSKSECAAPITDVLIACDAVRSKVGAQLFGAREPRSAYHVAWIGVSEVAVETWPYGTGHTVTLLGGGPRFYACTMKTKAGRATVYWYATEAESDPEHQRYVSRRRLLAIFRSRSVAVAEVMSTTIDGEPKPFRIQDLEPVREWAGGPVAMLGDAAHASTPDMGQGACQALESAVTLAAELARSADASRALGSFVRRRTHRTARVTEMSRATALMSMIHAPGLDAIRELGIRVLLPSITLTEFDRLFRGELAAMR